MDLLTRHFLKTLVTAFVLTSLVLAVATIPRLVVTDPTNSLGYTSNLYSGIMSYYVPDVGYHLTKVGVWINSLDQIVGYEMTFYPDVAGPSSITEIIGSSTGSNGPYSYEAKAITQKVVSVNTNGDNDLNWLSFEYADGTQVRFGNYNSFFGSWFSFTQSAQICKNLIGMKCNFSKLNQSSLNKSTAFCGFWDDDSITNNDFIIPIPDTVIYLNQITHKQYWTPQFEPGCFGSTITFQYVKNSVVVAKPVCITINTQTKMFQDSNCGSADLGVYTVTMTGTLSVTNQATGLPWKASSTFMLEILHDCLLTVITQNQAIINMTQNVSSTGSQKVTTKFKNSESNGIGNQWYCGFYSFVFTPTLAFVSASTVLSDQWFDVNATNELNEGIYTMSVSVSLKDYPTVEAIVSNSFTVTISCTVTSIAFLTADNFTKSVSLDLNPQPYSIPFQITVTPNCIRTYTLGSTPIGTAIASFLTIDSGTDRINGNIIVSGATAAHIQSWSGQSLKATAANGLSDSLTFTVVITDLCQTAIFKPTNPLSHMTITLPSSATSMQTFTILTNVQDAYPTKICAITATLSPQKVFISLAANFSSISVDASQIILPIHVGTNVFNLIVDSANFSATVTRKIYTFNVIISCTVNTLAITNPIESLNYIVNQGSLTTSQFTLIQSPDCKYDYTITSTYLKDGYASGTPVWIFYSLQKYTIQISQPADVGVYQISLTASIAGQSVLSKSFTFTITVLSQCTLTQITDKTIQNMSQKVSLASVSQEISFADLVATLNGNASLCGARVYTLDPMHSFLTIQGTSLSLYSSNVADVGVFNIVLTVSLASYPMVQKITKNLVVTIICEVQALTFTTMPSYQTTLQVGIDLQPNQIPFLTNQSPACGNFVSFELGQNQTFLSLSSLTLAGGNVQISGATILNHNTYANTLKASVNLQTITANFSIIIKDPCSTAIFQTSPAPLVDMIVNMPSLSTLKQNFTILNDIQVAHPSIICPITASLSPTRAFIILVANSVSVNASQIILPTELGITAFTLTVNSANFSGLVAQKTYNFNVIVSCTIASINPVQTLINVEHYPLAVPYNPTIVTPVFTVLPGDKCGQSILFTLIDVTSGSQQAAPSWISSKYPQIIIDSKDPQFSQFTLKLFATIPTSTFVIGTQTSLSLNLVFQLVGCQTTAVLNPGLSFTKISHVFGEPPQQQTFAPFADSYGLSSGLKSLCNLKAYNYTTTPSYNCLTVVPPASGNVYDDLWTIKVLNTDRTKVGIYSVTLTASLIYYPNSTPSSYKFQIELIEPCNFTLLNQIILREMYTLVGKNKDTQSFLLPSDTYAQIKNQPQACGERIIQFQAPKIFLTIKEPENPWGGEPFQIDLETNDTMTVGNYTVYLRTYLVNYPLVPVSISQFNVVIGMNHLPYFKPNITETISIYMTNSEQVWSFKLPNITDDDPGDQVQLTADFSSAANFMQLRSDKLYIDIADISTLRVSNIRPGYYPIIFTLDDNKDKTFAQTKLLIIAAPPVPLQPEPKKPCEPYLSFPIILQTYSYLSGSTAINISWNQFEIKGENCVQGDYIVDLKITAKWFDSRFPDEKDWLQYNKADLDNKKFLNFVTVYSQAIYDLKVDASITVEATIAGTQQTSSFTVVVSILPVKRKISLNNNIKARTPTFKIDSISVTGLIKFVFDDPIIVFNKANDAFMLKPLEFLDIKVIKNPKSLYVDDPQYIDSGRLLSVNVTKFERKEIYLQCEFSNPIYISLDPLNKDLLLVKVLNAGTFVSAIDFKTTVLLDSIDQIDLTRQLTQEMAQTALSIEKKQKVLVNTVSTSSLALNVVLGLSLKYLWGMINVLQFIIYMNEWKINWPANANLAIKTLRTIALGEFIDTNKMMNTVAAFYGIHMNIETQTIAEETTQEALNEESRLLQEKKTEIAGSTKVQKKNLFRTKWVVTAVVFLVLIVGLSCSVFLLYRSNQWFKTKLKYCAKYIKEAIFWNGFLRLYLQSFLKYCMIIFTFYFAVAKKQPLSNKDITKIVVYGLIAFIMFVAIPFFIQRILRQHRYGLYLSLNRKRYGSLYLGIKTKEYSTIFCVFSFLSVRLGFVILTFACASIPGILINLYMLLNNFNIIYIGWFSPYSSNAQNNIELFNQFLLQVVSYQMLLLANLMGSPLHEYNIGWAVIACIGVLFFVNMGYMLSLSLTELFRMFYLKRLKRQAENRRKLQQIQKLENSESLKIEQVQRNPSVSLKQQEALPSNIIFVKEKEILKKKSNAEKTQKVKIDVNKSLEEISNFNESLELSQRKRTLDDFDAQQNVMIAISLAKDQIVGEQSFIQIQNKTATLLSMQQNQNAQTYKNKQKLSNHKKVNFQNQEIKVDMNKVDKAIAAKNQIKSQHLSSYDSKKRSCFRADSSGHLINVLNQNIYNFQLPKPSEIDVQDPDLIPAPRIRQVLPPNGLTVIGQLGLDMEDAFTPNSELIERLKLKLHKQKEYPLLNVTNR